MALDGRHPLLPFGLGKPEASLDRWISMVLDVPDFSQERLRDRHPQWPDCVAWCRQIGDQWLDSGSTLLLIVSSAIIEREYNVLINPSHALASWVQVGGIRPFAFDPRLVAVRKGAA